MAEEGQVSIEITLDYKSRKDADARILAAVKKAIDFGWVDGDWHKAWVIDQMVRELLGPEGYQKLRAQISDWSEGDPP